LPAAPEPEVAFDPAAFAQPVAPAIAAPSVVDVAPPAPVIPDTPPAAPAPEIATPAPVIATPAPVIATPAPKRQKPKRNADVRSLRRPSLRSTRAGQARSFAALATMVIGLGVGVSVVVISVIGVAAMLIQHALK
jgi:hypothetical protein